MDLTHSHHTIPGIGPNLSPLELSIRTKLTRALTGRPPPNNLDRDLASPSRLGGITLVIPTQATDTDLLSSIKITEALIDAIQQDFQYSGKVVAQQLEAKIEVQQLRREQARQASEQLKESLPHSLKWISHKKRSIILANLSPN